MKFYSSKVIFGVLFLFGISKAISQTYGEDTLLAQIDGKAITVKEFMQRIRQLPPFLQVSMETDEGGRMALDWIIDWELVLADALKKGVDKEPNVEAEMAAAREQIIVSEYLNRQVRDKIVMPETALQEYYTKNREEFKLSEAIKVSHILVRSEKEAQNTLKNLKNGADFSKLARERSIDPSRRNGGQMGWFERSMMDPDFAKAAFALKKGEMSGIVHSQFGYHIIKVDDKRAPEYLEYDKVKGGIREKMVQKQAQVTIEQLRKELRAKEKITINENVLKTIKIGDDSQKITGSLKGGTK